MRPRTDHHRLTYSACVPWTPTDHRLEPRGGGGKALYAFRDDHGTDWWSDIAILHGATPDSLYTLDWKGARLDPPIATYEVSSERSQNVVPGAVFAAADLAPELNVDACYLAHAELRYAGCTFWRIAEYSCAVRAQDGRGALGFIVGRDRPPKRHGEAL